jgi:hypothetical protein
MSNPEPNISYIRIFWVFFVISDKRPNVLLHHCSKTNLTQFSFNLLRIKASTCFEHYLLIPRRRYRSGTWYIACVLWRLHQLVQPTFQVWCKLYMSIGHFYEDRHTFLPFALIMETVLSEVRAEIEVVNDLNITFSMVDSKSVEQSRPLLRYGDAAETVVERTRQKC